MPGRGGRGVFVARLRHIRAPGMTFRLRRSTFAAALLTLAATLSPGATARADNADKSSVLIYGEDYILILKEPPGWVSDTKQASKFGAHVILYPRGKQPDDADALIQIQVNRKDGEDIDDKLLSDVQSYKKQHPEVAFAPMEVAHPRYKTTSKLFLVKDKYYQYVTYLNPGPSVPLLLSAQLARFQRKATKEELGAYEEVVRSLAVSVKSKSGKKAPKGGPG
jgi:hypothetical protein